jgi:hypothetical protein
VFLFTDDGPGGAVAAVGGEGLDLNESIRVPPVVEETEVGDGRQEFVTIEVPLIAPLLDVGGAKRAGPRREAKRPRERRGSGVVPEETAPVRGASGCVTVRVH